MSQHDKKDAAVKKGLEYLVRIAIKSKQCNLCPAELFQTEKKKASPNSANPVKQVKTVKPMSPIKSKSPKMGFLPNDGRNSCFLDSTLVALMHDRKSPILSYIFTTSIPHVSHLQVRTAAFAIRAELANIRDRVHGNGKGGKGSNTAPCKSLRSLFKSFETLYKKAYGVNYIEEEWTHSQNSPGDVLNILMRIFDIPSDVRTSNVPMPFNAPEIFVADKTPRTTPVKITDYIPVTSITANDTGKTTVLKYKSAKCLYVSVMRNFLDEFKSTARVEPANMLKLANKNSKQLVLSSIIIHVGASPVGGHYVAAIRRGRDAWYLFDDLTSNYQLIATSFRGLLAWRDEYVMRNCVGFFYIQK